MKLFKMLQPMLQDRRGIAAVEYAVLIGVVGAAVFVAFDSFNIGDLMGDLLDAGKNAIPTVDAPAEGG